MHRDLSCDGRDESYLRIPGSVEDETFIFLSSLKAIVLSNFIIYLNRAVLRL